jgi:hypothetical protein
MIRTQVYITEEQARDIKLRAKRDKKREAEVIRDLLQTGLYGTHYTWGNRRRRVTSLATLGKRLKAYPCASGAINILSVAA